jgi:hypothetical protein
VSLVAEKPHYYNSGVIAFRQGSPLIEKWAQSVFRQNHQHRGDQDLLSWLIAHHPYPIDELPNIYNWLIGNGDNPNAMITHWAGESAKAVLAHQVALQSL